MAHTTATRPSTGRDAGWRGTDRGADTQLRSSEPRRFVPVVGGTGFGGCDCWWIRSDRIGPDGWLDARGRGRERSIYASGATDDVAGGWGDDSDNDGLGWESGFAEVCAGHGLKRGERTDRAER